MIIEQLVIASNNQGKITEFSKLLQSYVNQITSLNDEGIEGCPEPHASFIENAIAKARHAAKETGKAALADDSGICVDALQGRPGVHSARYSSTGTDQDNNQKLLDELADSDNRAAHYQCSLVLFRHSEDPTPLIAEASWHGQIAKAPQGTKGFGYDPIFVTSDGRTSSELDPSEKNLISHRGIAIKVMLNQLSKLN